MKKYKTMLATLMCLVMLAGTVLMAPAEGARAATKPAKPGITLSVKGSSVTVTISKTENASGYYIYMKSASDKSFKKVKTLKKDGTEERSYVIKKLSVDTYTVKVKAYANDSGKKVKGAFSEAQTIEIEDKTKDFANAKTGDYIVFGEYEQDNNLKNGKEPIEWLVLVNNRYSLFVISRYVLDCKPYNEVMEDITWETCDLRAWLNDEFYNTAFNEKEKENILTATISTTENFWYGTAGGNDTQDKVFLLSMEDMMNPSYGFYEKSSDYGYQYKSGEKSVLLNRRAAPTPYAIAQGALTSTKKKYQTEAGEDSCLYYWLRSAGRTPHLVTTVEAEGYLEFNGYGCFCTDTGVRPAIVINIPR